MVAKYPEVAERAYWVDGWPGFLNEEQRASLKIRGIEVRFDANGCR